MKILFFSKNAYTYYNKCKNPSKLLMDYFDIEVQKILTSLEFSFKKSPFLISISCDNSIEYRHAYNLDTHKYQKMSFDKDIHYYAIIYECL